MANLDPAEIRNRFHDPARSRPTFFDRLFKAIDQALVRLTRMGWNVELFTIIYPIEMVMRLWYHLDPRVYSERLRIRQVSAGRSRKKGDRFVLFVLYTRHTIPAFTRTVLDAIERSPLNLVISTNAKITPELRDELLGKCQLLVERADLGRDFGGYKDGIKILEQHFGTPERLILLNDSLFFFEKGLDAFLRELDGSEELIAMTEVFEHHYHLGSFAISFGPPVLKSKAFRRYWHRYRPITTRRWSIHRGEVGLTKMLMKGGFRPKVLYHGAQLIPYLNHQEARDFLEAVRLLPTSFRQRLFSEFEDIHATQTDHSLVAIGTLAKSIRRIEATDKPMFSDLKTANVKEMLEINHLTAMTHLDRETWVLRTLGNRIVSTIMRYNQMHVGGFLFMKYLGMPAVKRDIYFREVFRLDEVEDILEEIGEPLKAAVAADLRQKGCQSYLFGLPRLLAKHGSI